VSPTIPILVQARFSSQRLPGKVLRPILGKPMLAYTIERLQQVQKAFPLLIATSLSSDDDAIESFARQVGVACFRGPLDDVAQRMISAASSIGAEAFVRISGDSPLIDPALVDQAIDLYLSAPLDLASNILVRTFPKGQSVEVVSVAALAEALPEMSKQDQEHVTPLFYRHPRSWRLAGFESGAALGQVQMSVDTPMDFEKVSEVIARMKRPHWSYHLDELLTLYQETAPC
jgi:spore coat polysaccharide biosynthesis protein SpsF